LSRRRCRYRSCAAACSRRAVNLRRYAAPARRIDSRRCRARQPLQNRCPRSQRRQSRSCTRQRPQIATRYSSDDTEPRAADFWTRSSERDEGERLRRRLGALKAWSCRSGLSTFRRANSVTPTPPRRPRSSPVHGERPELHPALFTDLTRDHAITDTGLRRRAERTPSPPSADPDRCSSGRARHSGNRGPADLEAPSKFACHKILLSTRGSANRRLQADCFAPRHSNANVELMHPRRRTLIAFALLGCAAEADGDGAVADSDGTVTDVDGALACIDGNPPGDPFDVGDVVVPDQAPGSTGPAPEPPSAATIASDCVASGGTGCDASRFISKGSGVLSG
jgi:hypothetical protein